MAEAAPLRVFISYRREDSAGYAGRLHDSLAVQLAPAEIFMDVGSIEPGVDFTTAIANAVARCDVMLALIGPRWTTAVRPGGGPRLEDPDDYVVAEIAAALERDIRVIPVLIDGASMPEAAILPERIRGVARRNAWTLDTVSWPRDLDALVTALARLRPGEPGRLILTDGATSTAAAETRSGAGPSGPTVSPLRNKRWIVAVVAAIAGIAAFLVTRGDSPRDGGDGLLAVAIKPSSGPVGTTIELSADACPDLPEGARPNGIYFGVHDPRAALAEENPVTGGVSLIPGRPWKGQLRIPDGTSPGQYFVYASCYSTAAEGSYFRYVDAEFEVTAS